MNKRKPMSVLKYNLYRYHGTENLDVELPNSSRKYLPDEMHDLLLAALVQAIQDYGHLDIDRAEYPKRRKETNMDKREIENFILTVAPLLSLNAEYLVWRMKKYGQLSYKRWMNNRTNINT